MSWQLALSYPVDAVFSAKESPKRVPAGVAWVKVESSVSPQIPLRSRLRFLEDYKQALVSGLVKELMPNPFETHIRTLESSPFSEKPVEALVPDPLLVRAEKVAQAGNGARPALVADQPPLSTNVAQGGNVARPVWNEDPANKLYMNRAMVHAQRAHLRSSTEWVQALSVTCDVESDVDWVGEDVGAILSMTRQSCCAVCVFMNSSYPGSCEAAVMTGQACWPKRALSLNISRKGFSTCRPRRPA